MRKLAELLDVSSIGSAESLASAKFLHRKIKEHKAVWKAAVQCRIDLNAALGIAKLMKQLPRNPPECRLAAACYADPDVTPEDVAQWFNRSLHWAELVYRYRGKLRERYPADIATERQCCGIMPTDPTPEEIAALCERFVKEDPEPFKRVLTHEQFARRWNQASLSRVVG